MDELTVADLRKEEVVKQITTTSTFYLPPRGLPHIDQEMMQKLRGSKPGSPIEQTLTAMNAYPRSRWISAESPSPPAYGPLEQAAVSRLMNYTIPSEHLFLRGSQALRQFMTDLALQPELRRQYKEDPASVVNALPDMSAEENFALTLNHPSPIFKVMSATRQAIENGEELTREEIAGSVSQGVGMAAAPLIIIVIV